MDREAIKNAAEELAQVVPLVKAHLVGRDRIADSNVVAGVDDAERVFMGTGAIAPPYEPRDAVPSPRELELTSPEH